jgi:DNA-binding transcriptional ArsR family regulator
VGEVADELERVLGALANRHRREIVRELALHPQSISRLAAQRGLSLPAIHKHIGVLEASGLARRRKLGRTTFLVLGREPITALQGWLGEFDTWWGSDAASLDNYERYLTSEPDNEKERT